MFVLKSGNKFIGLDQGSGGYPFETDNIQQAKMWLSDEEANNYKAMFKKDWSLYQINGLRVTPV